MRRESTGEVGQRREKEAEVRYRHAGMTLEDVGMYSQWCRIGKLAEGGDAALVVLLLGSRRTEREGHAGRGGTDGELAVVGNIVVGGNLLLLEVGGHGVLCRGGGCSVHGIACVLVGAGEGGGGEEERRGSKQNRGLLRAS